jgi:transposase InsO family protein
MNEQTLKDLEDQALRDHERGLLTRTQLLNIIHRLDRISHFVSQEFDHEIKGMANSQRR